METNLQILVNGEEKVMEYFNNAGSLSLKDGDLINITVNPFGGLPDMVWARMMNPTEEQKATTSSCQA